MNFTTKIKNVIAIPRRPKTLKHLQSPMAGDFEEGYKECAFDVWWMLCDRIDELKIKNPVKNKAVIEELLRLIGEKNYGKR